MSAAQAFRSELTVRSGERKVNGKSILELMTLGAGLGAELELCATGGDAGGMLDALCSLFAEGFGEASA